MDSEERAFWRQSRASATIAPVTAVLPSVSAGTGETLSLRQRLQEIRDGFEPAFWVANISEIFERLSYYGVFSSLANYLHESLNIPTQQTGALTGLFGGMVFPGGTDAARTRPSSVSRCGHRTSGPHGQRGAGSPARISALGHALEALRN